MRLLKLFLIYDIQLSAYYTMKSGQDLHFRPQTGDHVLFV